MRMSRDARSRLLIVIVQIGQFLSKLNERIDEAARALQSCRRVELLCGVATKLRPVTFDMTAAWLEGVVSKRTESPLSNGTN